MCAACSDLDNPLPRWRRRLVEISSQTCTRVVLFTMGFWRPRIIGADHYYKGQEMGAVSIAGVCANPLLVVVAQAAGNNHAVTQPQGKCRAVHLCVLDAECAAD